MVRRITTTCAILLALQVGIASSAGAQAAPSTASAVIASVPYGANNSASGTFVHDGVTLYYETYGEGEPLLLIHGNGASIGSLSAQIEFFKTHRRVIVMDSRDQGRSGDSAGPLRAMFSAASLRCSSGSAASLRRRSSAASSFSQAWSAARSTD